MTNTAADAQRVAVSVIKSAVEVSRSLYAARAYPNSLDNNSQTELAELSAAIERIGNRMRARNDLFVERQLNTLGVGPESRCLRLHLGAGSRRVESWIGIDYEDAELCLDLTRGLPFPDCSARYVYAAHLLEHFRFEHEATRLIAEIYRVLEDGGVLRVVVPDIEQCLIAYVNSDREFFERRKQLWPWTQRCVTNLQHFLTYVGASSTPDDIHSHKYGYDYETLHSMLTTAGFHRVIRSDYMASQIPELRVDNWSKAAGFMCRGKSYSLFAEAAR
jgi:predicted SAM-dependent methyltransferase